MTYRAVYLVSLEQITLAREPWGIFDVVFSRVGWMATDATLRVSVDELFGDCLRLEWSRREGEDMTKPKCDRCGKAWGLLHACGLSLLCSECWKRHD